MTRQPFGSGKGKRRSRGERDFVALIDGVHQLVKAPIALVRDRLSTHVSPTMRELITGREWLTVFLLPAPHPASTRLRGCERTSNAAWPTSPSSPSTAWEYSSATGSDAYGIGPTPSTISWSAPAWPSTIQRHPDEPESAGALWSFRAWGPYRAAARSTDAGACGPPTRRASTTDAIPWLGPEAEHAVRRVAHARLRRVRRSVTDTAWSPRQTRQVVGVVAGFFSEGSSPLGGCSPSGGAASARRGRLARA